jgi:hypothetical protein
MLPMLRSRRPTDHVIVVVSSSGRSYFGSAKYGLVSSSLCGDFVGLVLGSAIPFPDALFDELGLLVR